MHGPQPTGSTSSSAGVDNNTWSLISLPQSVIIWHTHLQLEMYTRRKRQNYAERNGCVIGSGRSDLTQQYQIDKKQLLWGLICVARIHTPDGGTLSHRDLPKLLTRECLTYEAAYLAFMLVECVSEAPWSCVGAKKPITPTLHTRLPITLTFQLYRHPNCLDSWEYLLSTSDMPQA